MKKLIVLSLVIFMAGCSWVDYFLKKAEPYTASTYLDDLNERLDSLVTKVESISADVDSLLLSLSSDSVIKTKSKTEAQEKLDELKSKSNDIFKDINSTVKEAEKLSKDYYERLEKAQKAKEFQGAEGKIKLVGVVKDISDSRKKIDELVNALKDVKEKKHKIDDIFKQYTELIEKL